MEQSRIPALYPVQPDLYNKTNNWIMLTILVHYGNILNWIMFAPSSKFDWSIKMGPGYILMMDVLVPTEGSWRKIIAWWPACAVVANSWLRGRGRVTGFTGEGQRRHLYVKQHRIDAAAVHNGVSLMLLLNMFIPWFSLNLGDARSGICGRMQIVFAQSHHWQVDVPGSPKMESLDSESGDTGGAGSEQAPVLTEAGDECGSDSAFYGNEMYFTALRIILLVLWLFPFWGEENEKLQRATCHSVCHSAHLEYVYYHVCNVYMHTCFCLNFILVYTSHISPSANAG